MRDAALARATLAAPGCAHCGAPSPDGRFCCAGCAGAHALVSGLGLESFYRRRDAVGLAAAHVSAAPASGTDLAQTAADLVLLGRAPLAALPPAIAIARRAQRIARHNIALSLGYNVVAVPCAIAGLATPAIAAFVMATSSLAVILNALRAGRA